MFTKCLWLLLLWSMLIGISTSPVHHCQHVHQHYLPFTSASDSNSRNNLCGHTSCCDGYGQAMEKRIQSDFTKQMNSLSGEFSEEVWYMDYAIRHKLASLINETAERIINNSSDNTDTKFPHIVRHLFRVIETHINQTNSNTINYDQLRSLSEALFTSILEQHYNKKLFPSDYISCLLDAFRDSRFFSSIIDTFLKKIVHAIQTSSLIYRSLDVSTRLLAVPVQSSLTKECIKRMATMSHCSHCSDPRMLNASQGKPCESMCHETYHACLHDLDFVRLNVAWTKHVQQFERMIDTLVEGNNPETMFEQLFRYISTEEYIKDDDEITKKVKVACGTPLRYSRGIIEKNAERQVKTSPSPPHLSNVYSQSFYVSLKSLSHLMMKNKNMFANVTSKLCHRNEDNHCWDGNSIVVSYRRALSPPSPARVMPPHPAHASNNELFGYVDQLKRSIDSLHNQQFGDLQRGYLSNHEGSGDDGFNPDDQEDDGEDDFDDETEGSADGAHSHGDHSGPAPTESNSDLIFPDANQPTQTTNHDRNNAHTSRDHPGDRSNNLATFDSKSLAVSLESSVCLLLLCLALGRTIF